MNKKYDLEDRTARFGEDIIEFAKSLERNDINRLLGNQIVRSATILVQIIWRQMEQNQGKTFTIKLLFVKKKQKKQNIG